MTENNTEGRGTGRRDVLRSMGGFGLFGSVGRHVASLERLVPVNVGFYDSSGFDAVAGLADRVVRRFEFDAATLLVPGQFLTDGTIESLGADRLIRYIEPDRTFSATRQQLTSNISRIGGDRAHRGGVTGRSVDIAVLDSGIDETHPDLQKNVGAGASFIDSVQLLSSVTGQTPVADGLFGPNTPEWHDRVGHGTHAAGIVGAADNSRGVVGVCPDATLHAVRVLDSSGVGSASDIAAGIDHVRKQGWEVTNLSLGSTTDSKLVRDACANAADQGTLLVAATGNSGPCADCVGYPAAYSSVIGVGATTADDTLASFSASGPEIDLVAPGLSIRSTYTGSQRYKTLSGTSMAAPHVAGAGGLLMAEGYTNTEARKRLRSTAEDIGLSSNEQGAGLVDIPAALGL